MNAGTGFSILVHYFNELLSEFLLKHELILNLRSGWRYIKTVINRFGSGLWNDVFRLDLGKVHWIDIGCRIVWLGLLEVIKACSCFKQHVVEFFLVTVSTV